MITAPPRSRRYAELGIARLCWRLLWHGDVPRICDNRFIKWGLLAACFLCSLVSARAEYGVDAGDVIEIFVARVPDLQRRVSVTLDGTISFPLLGTVAVAGLSPSQLQAKIQAILATKVFQQRVSDGREIEVTIDPDEVTASVVEYRPIYVNGDVSKPGEYAYRAFMTAHQAIAMSGGFDLLHMRTNPWARPSDILSRQRLPLSEWARKAANAFLRMRNSSSSRAMSSRLPCDWTTRPERPRALLRRTAGPAAPAPMTDEVMVPPPAPRLQRRGLAQRHEPRAAGL